MVLLGRRIIIRRKMNHCLSEKITDLDPEIDLYRSIYLEFRFILGSCYWTNRKIKCK